MLILCDIDGTISDCTARQHLAAAREWDEFHDFMQHDKPIDSTVALLNALLVNADWSLIFLTGRPEQYRVDTESWLEEVAEFERGEDWLEVIMRPREDWTTDSILKVRMVNEFLLDRSSTLCKAVCASINITETGEGALSDEEWPDFVAKNGHLFRENIIIMEDRDRVVEAFRNDGWTCYQLQNGAF